jgi:hypothetical protein
MTAYQASPWGYDAIVSVARRLQAGYTRDQPDLDRTGQPDP